MTKTTKMLLGISIALLVIGLAFVTGIVNTQAMVDAYVALPLGAVVFGLFMIFKMLEGESALYDKEHQTHPAFVNAAMKANNAEESACGHSAKMTPSNSH